MSGDIKPLKLFEVGWDGRGCCICCSRQFSLLPNNVICSWIAFNCSKKLLAKFGPNSCLFCSRSGAGFCCVARFDRFVDVCLIVAGST